MTGSPSGRARSEPGVASGLVAAACVALALASGGGCAPSHRIGTPPDSDRATARDEDSAAPRGGTIVVGVAESVDPAHAPTPTNDSERLVFRNLYETLVRVGVGGAIHPGLASSWARSQDGREWTFDLRDGARFWDGTPLEPADVRLAWMATERRDRAAGREAPWIWLDGGAEAVTVHDDGRITARLTAPMEDSPAFFAHPALAIADRRRGETWPAGTGAFRPLRGAGPGDRELVCLPNEQRAREESPWVRLVFRERPGTDPRDLPAEGIDAFLVRDRATLGYFATVPDWIPAALPSDRIYVLFVPELKWVETGLWNDAISDQVRAELARDVVLSDADLARIDLPRTTPGTRAADPVDCAPRLIYRADDDDARRIAERLAFLGSRGCPEPADPRAIPLPPAEFERARILEKEGPFVVALDTRDPESTARLAKRGNVIPLVATRAHLVMRAGLAGVMIDGDGAVRFDRAGWTAEASAR